MAIPVKAPTPKLPYDQHQGYEDDPTTCKLNKQLLRFMQPSDAKGPAAPLKKLVPLPPASSGQAWSASRKQQQRGSWPGSGLGAASGQTLQEQHAFVQLDADVVTPYYTTSSAQARQQVFHGRARLAAEMAHMGMPPMVSWGTDVLVGKQVIAQPEPPSAHQAKNSSKGAPDRAFKGITVRANTSRGPKTVAQAKAAGAAKAQVAAAVAAASAASALSAGPAWRAVRETQSHSTAHNPILQQDRKTKARIAKAQADGKHLQPPRCA